MTEYEFQCRRFGAYYLAVTLVSSSSALVRSHNKKISEYESCILLLGSSSIGGMSAKYPAQLEVHGTG